MLRRLGLGGVRADGYGFQIEMTYLVVLAGGTLTEVPIAFADRAHGTSKMSGRIVAEALGLVSWWAVRDRAARLFGQPVPAAARGRDGRWWRSPERVAKDEERRRLGL